MMMMMMMIISFCIIIIIIIIIITVVSVTYQTRPVGSKGPSPQVLVAPQIATRLSEPLLKHYVGTPSVACARHNSDAPQHRHIVSHSAVVSLQTRYEHARGKVSKGPFCLHRSNTWTLSSSLSGDTEACLPFVLTFTGRCLADVHGSNID